MEKKCGSAVNPLLKKDADPKTLVGGELEIPTREVYQDLLKKLNYLNVALDMERADTVAYYGILKSPTLPTGAASPKRINFLVFGLVTGLLLRYFASF